MINQLSFFCLLSCTRVIKSQRDHFNLINTNLPEFYWFFPRTLLLIMFYNLPWCLTHSCAFFMFHFRTRVHNDMIWPPPFLRFVPHERISPVFHIAQYQQTFYKFLNFDKKVYLWINLHACQNWINISRSKISNDYTPSISLVLSLSPGHTSATIWPRRTSLPTASFIFGKTRTSWILLRLSRHIF